MILTSQSCHQVSPCLLMADYLKARFMGVVKGIVSCVGARAVGTPATLDERRNKVFPKLNLLPACVCDCCRQVIGAPGPALT